MNTKRCTWVWLWAALLPMAAMAVPVEENAAVAAAGGVGKEFMTRPMASLGGQDTTLILKPDGTCCSPFNKEHPAGYRNVAGLVKDWTNIVSISTGYKNFWVGLKANGTCVAAGLASAIEASVPGTVSVTNWTDIVAIAAGNNHAVGLKSDGTVVMAGALADVHKMVGEVGQWKDIVAVGAGAAFCVGVKKDGTCIAAGNNTYGQCDVGGWKDIVAVVCGHDHALGLRSDGMVVSTVLKPDRPQQQVHQCLTENWVEVVDITASGGQSAAVRRDGRIYHMGWDHWDIHRAAPWTDVTSLGVGQLSIVGIKRDGSVVAFQRADNQEIRSMLAGLNLGRESENTAPRVPVGRDRRLPWPPADWKPWTPDSAGILKMTAPPTDPTPRKKADLTLDLGNNVTMEFMLIPAGAFVMGCEASKDNWQVPVHKVRITKPFYMGRYEVTQEQWEQVMGKNPSYFTVPDGKTKRHPVEDVSQLDCRDFVAKLREMKPGVKADLPTEAQWEYACRAGSTNRFFFGDDESALGEYAWYDGNSGKTTHPVGQMKPNAWGLYDMYGNVWEWCRDVHNVYLYSEKAFPHLYPKNDGGEYVDPCFSLDALGPRVGAVGIRERGNINVLRGGSWASRAQYTSCACRTREWDEMRRSHVGFRLVIGADVAAKEKEPDKVGAK